MDWKLEIFESFVLIETLDHVGCVCIFAIIGLPVSKEQDRRIILNIVSFSFIDKINRFDNSVIDISRVSLIDTIDECEHCLTICIGHLRKIEWNFNDVIEKHYTDTISGSHNLNHCLYGMLHEVHEREAQVLVLGFAISLTGSRISH